MSRKCDKKHHHGSCKCGHKKEKGKCKCVEDVCTRDLRHNLCDYFGRNIFVGTRGFNFFEGQLVRIECGKITINDFIFGLTDIPICTLDFVQPVNSVAGAAAASERMAKFAARRGNVGRT